jgi:hypothetical protein
MLLLLLHIICSDLKWKLILFVNHLDMSLLIVENAGSHKRNPNGILGLLCREHLLRLDEYAGVTGSAYSFDNYAIAPDAVD